MFERALNTPLAIIFDFEQVFVPWKVLSAKTCSQTDINHRNKALRSKVETFSRSYYVNLSQFQ